MSAGTIYGRLPEYEPTPEDIRRECELIQATWSDTERKLRLTGAAAHDPPYDPNCEWRARARLGEKLQRIRYANRSPERYAMTA